MGESIMINNLLIFGLLVILVIINGLEDGLRDKGKKILAHIFNSLHIAGWMFFAYIFWGLDFKLIYAFQYILIRFALFDLVWNLINGLPLFFTGTTSLYGKFWKWINNKLKWNSEHFLFWIKLISLLIAISFITY